MSFKMMQLYVA